MPKPKPVEATPAPVLPVEAHDYTPDPATRRGRYERCVCGLPRKNRIHTVWPFGPMVTR
jgi:hypothetical protein